MLFDDGSRVEIPREAYVQQESIPKEERCDHCDGIGMIRILYSGCFGGQRGKDYKVCLSCHGSGRKDKKNV
jgi:hypothetical protein